MGHNEHFTKEEAETKVDTQIRVRDDSLAYYGIKKGMVEKVMRAEHQPSASLVPGSVMTPSVEVWAVYVGFEVSPTASGPIPFTKEEYERCLEEIKTARRWAARRQRAASPR